MFIQEFGEFISETMSQAPLVIISGDVNIPLNKKTTPDTQAFNDLLECHNLRQQINAQTHQQGNTLDIIITKENADIRLSEPTEVAYLSDHALICTTLEREKPTMKRKLLMYRQIKNIDEEKFQTDLCDMVSTLLKINDFEMLASKYNEELLKVTDRHAPIVAKPVTLRNKTLWFNEEQRN